MKKKEHLYSLAIGYFLIFVLLTVGSGVALFLVENGFTPKAKSFETIMELLSPHLLGMSIVLFVVTHFLLFSKKYTQKFSLKVFLWVVLFMMFDQSSYLFILMGLEWFSVVKLVSIVFYIIGICGLLIMVFG